LGGDIYITKEKRRRKQGLHTGKIGREKCGIQTKTATLSAMASSRERSKGKKKNPLKEKPGEK